MRIKRDGITRDRVFCCKMSSEESAMFEYICGAAGDVSKAYLLRQWIKKAYNNVKKNEAARTLSSDG